MKIFLMRHGEAELSAVTDQARQLTERGRLKVQAKIDGVRKRMGSVQKIIHSPYQRAAETAKIAADVLQIERLDALPQWTPDAAPTDALGTLEDYADHQSILVVTHMPLIAYVEALLCDGSLKYPASFNCAEIVEIDTEWPAAGLAIKSSRL